MSNLTITIDDELLRAARVKAVQQGTSVNEICRQAIAAFVDDKAEAQAKAQAFWEHATTVKLGPALGPPLSREALYDERRSDLPPAPWPTHPEARKR